MTKLPESLLERAIQRPKVPQHMMRLKPVERLVRVHRDGLILAETHKAIRLIEIGRDIYDPVFYIPQDDVSAPLSMIADKTTHCPLKGDAEYFTLEDEATTIAWTYSRPLEWALELKGLIAFYPDMVRVEEVGDQSN